MTIPEPPTMNLDNHLDFVVMSPPNDNTDGNTGSDDDCVCGHAKTDHHPFTAPDGGGQPAWQCVKCSCTRAYPTVASTP
jgi:hypothetical protein